MLIITASLIVMTIIGIATQSEHLFESSCICLAFVGLMGWLVIGNVVSVKSERTTNVTARILPDRETIHLSVDGRIIATFNDVHTFNILQEKNTIKIVGTYGLNMYNSPCGTTNWTIPE